MNPKISFFDCETQALPDDQLIQPKFNAPANYKDPVKIDAYIQDCIFSWKQSLALSPLTGQILTIGILDDDGFQALTGKENEILGQFWRYTESLLISEGKLVGFNSNSWDLVFLFKRSWAHHMKPCPLLRNGRYWAHNCVDVRELWQLGDRAAEGSLDVVSRFLGGAGKEGSGADFSELWFMDREKALAYLKNDLEICRHLYELMV